MVVHRKEELSRTSCIQPNLNEDVNTIRRVPSWLFPHYYRNHLNYSLQVLVSVLVSVLALVLVFRQELLHTKDIVRFLGIHLCYDYPNILDCQNTKYY